jgi:hypothetical protein
MLFAALVGGSMISLVDATATSLVVESDDQSTQAL